MIMEDFYNEGVFECNTCKVVFKTYYKGDTGDTNFCPNCGSSDINWLDSEE